MSSSRFLTPHTVHCAADTVEVYCSPAHLLSQFSVLEWSVNNMAVWEGFIDIDAYQFFL